MSDNKKSTIAFMTLGCKVNYYETEKLTEKFKSAGFSVVQFDEYADIYVVNTCTVTNIADRKSRKMLHRASRVNKDAIVVALGCFAEAEGDKLLSDESISLVIGNSEKENAFDIIMTAIKDKLETNIENSTSECDINYSDERTRAYVKIQDGCNQFCSYCKIPYVRGRLKSRSPEDIVNEIRKLSDIGYKEVVLTGIHLSSYGVDVSECKNFIELEGRPLYELIRDIAEIDGIERIRLGSLEPRIVSESFAASIAEVKELCPHFHLSLQSGCDETLVRMKRKYNTAEYRTACDILRKYFDNPSLTTDVIVGFPGETEEEFETSMKFVKDIGFSSIHVFKYSKRDGTVAAGMDNQVDEQIKNERSKKLIEAGNELSLQYAKKYIGSTERCLFEEKVFIDGVSYWVGHNERYLKIAVDSDEINDNVENTILSVVPEFVNSNNILVSKVKNALRK